MVEGKCALCKKRKSLRKSHIIPKFVSKWLKETSATGFLRGVKKPTKRKQDLPKLPLLCEDCEQIFSKLENYFASKIFYPIIKESKKEIVYDNRLLRFLASLSWRTLVTSYSDQVKYSPWIKEHLDKAEEIWRRYLLQESCAYGSYEHHLFFVDYLKKETGMPRKFQWYTLRATDSTLASNQDIVFAFTHFPHVFFVSSIFPLNFSGWNNTKIKNKGKLTTKWEIHDNKFGAFLVNRSIKLLSSTEISDNKILKAIERDPEKFLKSESLKVMIQESKRERQKRIKSLPKHVRALIDIIERSVDNPEYDALQQSWINYTKDMVANELSHIPKKNAIIIDALIQSTRMLADQKHKNELCDFETLELIGRFMVNICGTKDEQLELLAQAIDELKKKKKPYDQRIIVVFSFNPNDREMPFETGFYVD